MKKIVVLSLLLIILPTMVNAVNLNTESIVVQDINSGRIFYSKNMDDKRLIASTTKIMTAIVAIENSELYNIVKSGDEILTMYGSNIYLEYNENMVLLDLLYGLMLRSGNDATVTIANYVGGSIPSFVKMMNEKAKELGMEDTTYNNPTGLDDDTKNYSTARDLSKLYSYAYKNNIFKMIVGTKIYTTKSDKKSYEWSNKNKILKLYDKATGGKTGYTPLAKRVLVTSASNKDLDVVISSFNNIYDYDLHTKLYEDVFNNYRNYLIVNKDTFKLEVDDSDKLYIKESFSYPLTSKEKEKITTKIDMNNDNKSNIKGYLYVYLDNEIIKKIDIYKQEEKTSFFDKIKKIFSKIID